MLTKNDKKRALELLPDFDGNYFREVTKQWIIMEKLHKITVYRSFPLKY